jgi:hypothetical protein
VSHPSGGPTGSAASGDTGEQAAAAAGWVVHLRSGGTTPWPDWLLDVGRPTVSPYSTELPGAPQLELLRRLNVLGFQPRRVDQVLDRPAPGRGAVDLELPWPPAEPAEERDLVRVACGVLADLTAALPVLGRSQRTRLATVRQAVRRGRGRGSFPVVLTGPPHTVAALRAGLAAAGASGRRSLGRRRPRRPEHAVLVTPPIEEALHEVWAHRAERGPVASWGGFLAGCAERDRLPPTLELGAVARRWARRAGAEHVHVVAADSAPELLEELVGVRPAEQRPPATVPLLPSHAALLRRVNRVLPFVVPQGEVQRRRAMLVEQLRADAQPWEPALGPERLAVPADVREWVSAATGRVAGELAAAGVWIHDDPADLLSCEGGSPGMGGGALRSDVVTAAVRMIHRVGRVVDEAGAGRRG